MRDRDSKFFIELKKVREIATIFFIGVAIIMLMALTNLLVILAVVVK